MKSTPRLSGATAVALVILLTPGTRAQPTEATVIELTQVPCQFLESEGGVDRGYKSRSIKDCEAINAKSGATRGAAAKPLQLKPGRYVFRVKNASVPYELGFWVRGASAAGRVTLPSTSGGGLTLGKTQDYEIVLKSGEYLYSCPLNTTPDYKLIVSQ
jgi:hypothetical protein